MQQNLEQQIRERAYHLWVAEGRHDGDADRYWLLAEREVLAATVAPAPKRRSSRRPTRDAAKPAVPAVRRRAS